VNQSNNFVGQHIFSQLLSVANRQVIVQATAKHHPDKYYKAFTIWDHFVSMMYCVLSGCTSLREIEVGLAAFEGKLNHLGLNQAPSRSTISDGNKQRKSVCFQSIYEQLMKQCKSGLSDSKLPTEVLKQLFALDSTVFQLFKAILKTAGRNPIEGKKKGGIKKHTLLQVSAMMPVLVRFTAAAEHDQNILPEVKLPSGSYLTFDKAFNNYAHFAAFTEQGVWFITRQKDNAVYQSITELEPGDKTADSVLKEEIIEVSYQDQNHQQCSLRLRRIAWWDVPQQRLFVFITNNFEQSPQTIALIYRHRWKIELFFKKLKQNFPLAYFVGDNQNAIEIQIWCALIGLLLLSAIHHQHQSIMSFSIMVALIRTHLINYLSLSAFLQQYNQKKIRRKKPPDNAANLFSPPAIQKADNELSTRSEKI